MGYFLLILWGGEQISVKMFAGLVCVMLIWFVMALNFLAEGAFLFIQIFFFYYLHLQIIASISPKASVENSSAQ